VLDHVACTGILGGECRGEYRYTGPTEGERLVEVPPPVGISAQLNARTNSVADGYEARGVLGSSGGTYTPSYLDFDAAVASCDERLSLRRRRLGRHPRRVKQRIDLHGRSLGLPASA